MTESEQTPSPFGKLLAIFQICILLHLICAAGNCANYFRIYFHYAYFNLFRYIYLQADNVIAYIFLIPTIVSGRITLGIMNQILRAFGQVASSFQFLVNSWTTIIDLISIYKRLEAFEVSISGLEISGLDKEYDANQNVDNF